MDETATCREYVRPRLESAGWNDDTHLIIEQKTFTDGRIVPTGRKIKRRPQKRADYLLCYTRDFPIAVVEAKAEYKLPGDGLQQAKDYAETLGVKFAYALMDRASLSTTTSPDRSKSFILFLRLVNYGHACVPGKAWMTTQ